MKILFNTQDGKLFYSVYDGDWFRFSHTTNIPLETFEIDEVDPDNKDICLDLVRSLNRVDIDGNAKYYMQYNDVSLEWELFERDGWVEYVEDFI